MLRGEIREERQVDKAHHEENRYEQDTLEKWLRRSDCDWLKLCALVPELQRFVASPESIEQVTLEAKYGGYIERQAEQVERFQRLGIVQILN